MPGDYSRKTFDPKKHYSGVLMQQGRVQVDADWNEQVDIQRYRTETETGDLIGASGAPIHHNGFKIGITPDGSDLTISPGRIYVDGILCELEAAFVPVSFVEINPQQIIVPHLMIDGHTLEVGQWVEISAENKEEKKLLKVSNIDSETRVLTLNSGVTEFKNAGPAVIRRITTYLTQPYYPNPDTTCLMSSPPQSGMCTVFLDVWKREINFRDDKYIHEVALGEADTATRIQIIQQVKLLPMVPGYESQTSDMDGSEPICDQPSAVWDNFTAPSTGVLNAKTTEPGNKKEPCLLPPSSGYRGLENQLYRVEIHTGGAHNSATFKWSRDNATVETMINKIDDTIVTVADVGRDDVLGFAAGQWIEILDDESTLKFNPNQLIQIDKVDPANREITLKVSAAQYNGRKNLKMRRWDQRGSSAAADGIKMTNDWVPLEPGIEILLSEGEYHSGDYWLIPARTARGEIEWPPFEVPNTKPIPQPPAGIRHHYSRLALLESNGAMPVVKKDCRKKFKPLTDAGIQVIKVLARESYYRDVVVHDGTSLTTDVLANGLRIVLDQNIEQTSATEAACFVTSEIPYPVNEADIKIWGDSVIGYHPLVLAAEVSPVNKREILWNPDTNIKSLLLSGMPESVWRGRRVKFERDWDVFDPEGLGLQWSYRLGNVIVDAVKNMGGGSQTGLGSVSISKERIKENLGNDEGYIEMDMALPRGNGNVGMVFNWVSEQDYWMFLCRRVWIPVGYSGAYESFSISVTHVVNGQANDAYNYILSSIEGPVFVSLYIDQWTDQLHFTAVLRSGNDINTAPLANRSFELLEPGSLLENSRIGIVARYSGEVDISKYKITYHQDETNLVPVTGASPVLTRLTVKRNFLRPEADPKKSGTAEHTNSVKPCADHDVWFWLVPPYRGYPYGHGQLGIGGDLL